jgi:23S rRNA (cytosine1962-C5)-methyltransferase
LAVIYDRRDRFLAVGLFDPDSPLRVRVLHTGKPVSIDTAWWRERFRAAGRRRQGLFEAATTGFRCVHGESDGFPGLVLDRYADTLVLKLYTAAWFPRIPEMVNLIRGEMVPRNIVLRLSRNIRDLAREGFALADGQALYGPVPEGPVIFLENGLRFEADVVRGQKTGFFLDQRENRREVSRLAPGRDVLNAFSFTGGFSLASARGHARSVLDLDISPAALAAARRNFDLNRTDPAVAACRREEVQADAFEWFAAPIHRRFGLIVLDPPSLAKKEAERGGAVRAYARLAAAAVDRLLPGGILVAASCSAHVSREEFFEAVRGAARRARRPFRELQTTGHAADHPATFAEAEYLKCIYLQC